MRIKITKPTEVNAKFLKVKAGVRYWEDTEINGESDTELGTYIPCKNDDYWEPIIDIDNGLIINWEQGKYANVHYKVCDNGVYQLLDENMNIIISLSHIYVPDTLCPKERGYGDYIIMDIDETGKISDWDTSKLEDDFNDN